MIIGVSEDFIILDTGSEVCMILDTGSGVCMILDTGGLFILATEDFVILKDLVELVQLFTIVE